MRWAAVFLSCLLTCQNVASAQAAGLNIVVIEGEGAINSIQRGAGKSPIIEVRDENDKPVASARVTFSLPERGPGGSFFGAGNNLSVTTNEQGRAIGAGFRPNSTEGRFQIRVTAVQGDRTGAATISQLNTQSGGDPIKASGKFWRSKTFAIVVVGAIVGGVVASKAGGDDSTPATPGTTITPGTISVGTPR